MTIRFTRDYRDRNSGQFGFSSGIYANFREQVDFRYLDFQIRGIGQLSLSWTTKGAH